MDIVISPDPRLTTKCEPIEKIDRSVKRVAKQLADTMYKNDGVGLAAPQVGYLKQLIVIDIDWPDGKKNPMFLINPRIVDFSEEAVQNIEGCLSVPGISVPILRPRSVTVQALNLDGELMEYSAHDDLLTYCLQHEYDHLQGITMLERVAPSDRMQTISAYREALAHGAKPGQTS